MTDDRTVAERRADELDELYASHLEAERLLARARKDVVECVEYANRADLRYKRAALWIKGDELRKQLAEVEAAAANIVLPKGD